MASSLPRTPNKLTPAQRDEIRTRYQAGEGQTRLAREFGVKVATICYHLRPQARESSAAAGTPLKRRLEAVARYHQGENSFSLAREFGVTDSTIRVWVKRHGARTLPPQVRHLRETIRRDWLTAPAAATLLGIDKGSLCELLRRGRLPGAFRLDENHGSPWLIPRAAVTAWERKRRERKETQ